MALTGHSLGKNLSSVSVCCLTLFLMLSLGITTNGRFDFSVLAGVGDSNQSQIAKVWCKWEFFVFAPGGMWRIKPFALQTLYSSSAVLARK